MIQVRHLSKDDLRKLIAQAKAIAEFTPSPTEHEIKINKELDELLFGGRVQDDKPVQKRRKKK